MGTARVHVRPWRPFAAKRRRLRAPCYRVRRKSAGCVLRLRVNSGSSRKRLYRGRFRLFAVQDAENVGPSISFLPAFILDAEPVSRPRGNGHIAVRASATERSTTLFVAATTSQFASHLFSSLLRKAYLLVRMPGQEIVGMFSRADLPARWWVDSRTGAPSVGTGKGCLRLGRPPGRLSIAASRRCCSRVRSSTRASNSTNSAPTQRETPPPNGRPR